MQIDYSSVTVLNSALNNPIEYRYLNELFTKQNYSIVVIFTGPQIRVLNGKLFFLFLNQNMCCGYSKEPSQ